MDISSQLVKNLREKTGSGVMDCKRALVDAKGDIEQAIVLLKKKGQASAERKASRIASNGAIYISQSDTHFVMLECNCETEPVAKLNDFNDFVHEVANVVLIKNASTVEDILNEKISSGETVNEKRLELVSNIGENIVVRRFDLVEKSKVNAYYIHDNRIGAIVCLESGTEEVAKNTSMHVAASNPLYLEKSNIPPEKIEQEKEIILSKLKEEKKPEAIQNKIAEGKLNKIVKELCLLSQPYIRDDSKSVGEYLSSNEARILRFARCQLGEGIDQKKEDFATEVYNQIDMAKKAVVTDQKSDPFYKRIVLKVSGESLMGEDKNESDIFNLQILNRLAEEIRSIHDLGVELLLMVGGGNICRGKNLEKLGMNRVIADQMGMLSTIINGLAIKECFVRHKIPSQVLSALNVNYICNQYSQRLVEKYLRQGNVIICTAGTGNPFFTTDTAASLRAIEIGAEIIFKATKVDGIYSNDPVKDSSAKRYDTLSYDFVIKNKLAIVDSTAVVMCRDHNIPLGVINIFKPGEILRAIQGRGCGTIVK